jgi:hypothetical protein
VDISPQVLSLLFRPKCQFRSTINQQSNSNNLSELMPRPWAVEVHGHGYNKIKKVFFADATAQGRGISEVD